MYSRPSPVVEIASSRGSKVQWLELLQLYQLHCSVDSQASERVLLHAIKLLMIKTYPIVGTT